ncbi:MAG: ShlB/FhaC/HecB family hemolysin secretion/activation protein [Proteobacteria bacterium]|nr:ShlB/FhaC/HecB family hemolysin secretion/activation protein [Pseudomonadota bacterium]
MASLVASLVAAVVAGTAGVAVAQAATPQVDVRRVVIEGATLIPAEQLLADAPTPRGPTDLAVLQRLAERVQRRYAEAGYGGVVAYLPAQGVVDGTVRIVVVEGRVASITVRDVEGPAAVAARAALPALEQGRTPRLRTIDRQLQLANENPARQMQVLLSPGERSGEIAAELSVQQHDPWRAVLSAENTGNPGTGRWRVGAALQHADVSGVGDVAALQLQTSPSHASGVVVASIMYRRPLPGILSMLEGYAAYSDIDAGTSTTPVGDLSISGRGQLAGLRLTHYLPFATELDQRAGVAIDRRAYVNRCAIAGLPAGACGSAVGDVTVMPLTLEYSLRSSGAFGWAASLAWTRNFGWGGGASAGTAAFEALRPGARSHYSTWHLATSAQTALAESWRLDARLNVQWTNDALVSGEQFGIGGAASVRGYREREIAGDRGAAASLELTSPELLALVRSDAGASQLRAFGFVDGGVVANRFDAPCRFERSHCNLAGAGVGLQFDRGGLSLRLALAHALRDGIQTDRGDTRLHAAAQYAF